MNVKSVLSPFEIEMDLIISILDSNYDLFLLSPFHCVYVCVCLSEPSLINVLLMLTTTTTLLALIVHCGGWLQNAHWPETD